VRRWGFVVALALATTSGCAETPPPAPNPRAARDYVPDGGWASYRPAWNDQHPANDPGGPLTGPVVPVIPGDSTVPSTVH
jgi:hypothetical protein